VQHARAVTRAAHPRVRDPDHVAHALREQLLRDRQHAPLRHAGPSERPRVLQDQDRIGGHGQRRIVDPFLEVVVVREHDGAPLVPQQAPVGRGVFDHRAAGREVAPQHGDASFRADRPVARRDHLVVAHDRPFELLGQRPAGHGDAARVQQIAQAIEHAAQPAGVIKVLHQELA
jgi:hypothetical protein